MPEGPEVKIMMNNLATLALGKYLISVDIIKESFRKKTKGLDILPNILPIKIVEVCTRGKFGYMLLNNGSSIGLTFGMTGNIRTEPTAEQLDKRGDTKEKYMKHCSVRFTVQDDSEKQTVFYFHTTRNFAWMYYFNSVELTKKLSAIGPSILSDEPLDRNLLLVSWRKFNGKHICTVLLDQKPISGIGNYIKSEILYRTNINPVALVKALEDDHLWGLYMCARDLAAAAYETGGTSLYTYTGLQGDKSDFKYSLHVYDRSTDPHGNKVHKIDTPDKRTTHWVPELQTIGTEMPIVVVHQPKIKIRIRARDKTKN